MILHDLELKPAASRLLVVLLLFGGTAASASAQQQNQDKARFDVLVFAPHPDDEILGCAGAILQALAKKQRVGVVILTNGDGFPKAAAVVAKKTQNQLTAADFLRLAAERQQQSLDGMKILGVPKSHVFFLAYPDSGLAQIYQAEGAVPLRQEFTNKDRTYTALVADYHSQAHGRPAAYTRQELLRDLAEILKASQPKEIYVTHEVDQHSDHKAAFWFVRDAARQAAYRGKLFTYVVHGKQQPETPVHRVKLTAAQVERKKAAIKPHQIPTVHDTLGSYATPEEVFWLGNVKPTASN